MKNVFITGIAGFIGFHLAKRLHALGYRVFGCDCFNNYYDPSLKRARVANLSGIPIYEWDICNTEGIESVIKNEKITHFVNLAAQAGVRYSLENPNAYIHSNLNGFSGLLEICRKYPEMKFLFASSSSVYGLNTKIPFSENDLTDKPANLYGATKKANEMMAHAYHHLFKIPAIGLRLFTVYGPWGRPDMAYFSFTRAILEGKPITVYGEGKLERDFTFIDDIVAGIVSALDCNVGFEVFNLGSHRPEKVSTLISLIETYTGKKAIIDYQPMHPGDMEKTYADIEKSRSIFGFEPKISLEEGIARFTSWYQEYN